MNIKLLFNNFLTNFFKGGLLIGISITIIDLLSHEQNLINFYAAASASFFLVQVYQFYYINKQNSKLTHGFVLHSIYGNILWFIYVISMYLLYINDFSSIFIIITSTLMWLFGTLIYFLVESRNIKSKDKFKKINQILKTNS